MKINILFTFFISALIMATSVAQEKYGKEIILAEKTEISDIISHPLNYIGKEVLIEGEVLKVCKMAGCWMEIANAKGDKMKVKVKDGEIVFPQEAIGKNALVEGEVYKIELDEEQAKDYLEHMSEDAGEEFDPSTIIDPITIYQIKGIGAVIQ